MSSIKLKHSSGNSMSIGAPATNPASDLELKLPATVGTAGQALVNSGTAGTLEFATVVKSGDGKSTNTTSAASDVGYSFENTNTTSGFGMKIKGGGTDADRYIVRFDDAAGNERARISAAGQLNIGTTVDALGIDTGNNTGINLLGSGRIYVKSNDHSEWNIIDGGAAIRWRYGNTSGSTQTQVGQVTINSSSTTYSTSSDYRLKDNVVAISDGITRLKTLKPYRFNFKVDPDTTVDGFFAHEVTPVVPEAIVGTKDEVDSDDNPVYQGIDQSKLVPLLTAALQEAITEIETLKTKVAALEAA